MNRRFLSALAGGALLLQSTATFAHITMANDQVRAGYQELLTVLVPHGCGPEVTTEIRIKIPPEVTIAVPEEKPGWDTQIVMRQLDEPVPMEGGIAMITEVVDEFVWSGGSLPVDKVGTFSFIARMPNTPGRVVFFKTIQGCGETQERWIETKEDDEPIFEIYMNDRPSPFVELLEPRRPQLGLETGEFFKRKMERGGPVIE